MTSIRHDWYQTEQKVVIDVLIKNANSRNCSVDIQPNCVSIRGDDVELDFKLAHEIDTTKSSFRVLSVKIEISLQKLIGERWNSLIQANEEATNQPAIQMLPVVDTEKTSKKNDKNWDRVVQDAFEKEEIDKVCD